MSAVVSKPSLVDAVVPIGELLGQVRGRWVREGAFSAQTLERCSETLDRFVKRLAAQGVSDVRDVTPTHCSGFVDAATRTGRPPELTTRHARRTALRMFFRTARDLGHAVGDPTIDLRLPARTATAARPLSDLEVTLCRAASRMGHAGGASLQRATCWALGEATAVTSEISAVRVRDVDDRARPAWVELPGTSRHDARRGRLSDWGATVVRRQVALLAEAGHGADALLTYRGAGEPGQAKAQAAVCNAVGAVLASAGLTTEADVRPASIRNWAGRRLYDDGLPLEQVARRLGARSLDSAATDIGLRWRS